MIAVLAFWAALSRPALAQKATWDIEGSTSAAQLGVPYALSGTVISALNQDLAFDLSASTDSVYAVADARFGRTILDARGRVQPFTAEILPLAVGKIIATLTCIPPTGFPVFKSPPIIIDVAAPALQQDARPNDIKAPRLGRPPLWPWFALAAILAAGYALYRIFSRRNEEESKEAVDPRPAEVIAQSELAALQKSGWWESGRYKDYYSALTDILKRYLERRYGFTAPQMTTSEILRALRHADLDRVPASRLKGILDRADLIKFAKIPPESRWGPDDIASSFQIVRETTPTPIEPHAAGQEAKVLS